MSIVILQHVPFEGPDGVAQWLEEQGHSYTVLRMWTTPSLPSPKEVSWLIVLGGPMNTHQTHDYPWLMDEIALIKACVEQTIPVLGLCLGSQLMTCALGGTVVESPEPEIGWHPITLTPWAASHPLFSGWPTAPMTVFHWHRYMAQLPDGAQLIASSPGCPNQGYAWGESAIGLQFHLEFSPETIHTFVTTDTDELEQVQDKAFIQSAEAIMAGIESYHSLAQRWFKGFLKQYYKLIVLKSPL